ncbi:MAG: conjugal transfer protein TraL, partial [Oscillospiraceae bacterium]
MEHANHRPWLSLSCGGGGLLLLLLALLRTNFLAQGTLWDHVVLLILLGLLALLAAGLLYLEGVTAHVLCLCLLPIGAAFFLRVLMLDHITYDYQDFLSQWAAFFRDNGGFSAVKLPVGNYNAPYLYFMALISYFKVPDLYLIKLFSVLFDVLLAWGGLRLAKTVCKDGSNLPYAVFCALLLLPTVMLNGAYWGQCDSIYAALTLHALASGLDRKPVSSVLLLAVAFSFKLQT